MRILIVRHAIAEERDEWAKINPDDELRPLTKKGIKQFIQFSKQICKLVEDPDLFLTSPLVRAEQTADILKKRYKKNFRAIKELKPEASCARLLKFLSLSKKKNIVLVGHEPFLSEFVSYCVTGLVKSDVILKKGGCCLLIAEKMLKGSAKIEVLYQPKYFI